MYKFDKINLVLSKNDKPVKKPTKKDFALLAISLVQEGKELGQLPDYSECGYTLAEILEFIENTDTLAQEFAKAESIRVRILKEKYIAAEAHYHVNPSPENLEAMKGIAKLYSDLSKNLEQTQPVNIEFKQVLPNDFWDKKEMKPEFQRSSEERESWEKMINEG